MGYATVLRVPSIRTYEQALRVHDNIKPLRGRAEVIKPLGSRRDADTYSIRKKGEDVELILYKTPVITFKPDGEVELRSGGWHTVSTNQFFYQVLNIRANGKRNHSVLTIDGCKYVLKDDVLCLRARGSSWEVLNAKTQRTLSLDRRATAEVRKKYEEFYKYLKGFVNLRSEGEENIYTRKMQDHVNIPLAEFDGVFKRLADTHNYCYMDKRGQQHLHWRKVTPKQYRESSQLFEQLIRPDQPEDEKHTNFYKAALLLIAKEAKDDMDIRSNVNQVLNVQSYVSAEAKHIVPLLDAILFMMNADKVIKSMELPMGKVSSGAYESWMIDWEEEA